jgi:peptidoglycan hydrolase-like protein with peptidoglycan-binding domain
MIHPNPALGHHFLQIAVAKRISQVPPHAQKDDDIVKVSPSERRWSALPHRITLPEALEPFATDPNVKRLAMGWQYDCVSIGYPGPVIQGHPVQEPYNLGGWVGFNFGKAFGRPVKIINDAAMQALGSYQGGRLLFLGLGAAMIVDGLLEPMELAHLPYKSGKNI